MELDEAEDWAWCEAQFAAIKHYVESQGIPHGLICDWPEWYAAPYVGLWAVEDPQDPGFVGHWIIAGDSTGSQPQPVAFDHLAAEDIAEPKEALAGFAKRWAALAAKSAQGEHWQGSPLLSAEPAQQAAQLARQAKLLALWAEDDELWQQD